MGKDKSMSFWTPEKLDEKAKEDAENDSYNPPHSWWPGRYSVGTEARERYDRAFNLHHNREQTGQCKDNPLMAERRTREKIVRLLRGRTNYLLE